jgi:hypothetical protein
MRRTLMVCASAVALVMALAVGPFGAAAAAPYVYGCTPVTPFNSTTSTIYYVALSIYNGSATSATVTTKVLAGNGSILNQNLNGTVPYFPPPPPFTATLGATKTLTYSWGNFGGVPATDATVAAAVRVVSTVPVSATLSHAYPYTGAPPVGTDDWRHVVCTPQVP